MRLPSVITAFVATAALAVAVLSMDQDPVVPGQTKSGLTYLERLTRALMIGEKIDENKFCSPADFETYLYPKFVEQVEPQFTGSPGQSTTVDPAGLDHFVTCKAIKFLAKQFRTVLPKHNIVRSLNGRLDFPTRPSITRQIPKDFNGRAVYYLQMHKASVKPLRILNQNEAVSTGKRDIFHSKDGGFTYLTLKLSDPVEQTAAQILSVCFPTVNL
ncbi:hypothetical protein IWQ60_007852 [Tieghemiomyces parasiticus]|uniref:Uncharacterized protein n=1 Tax=Tieghemiomyces parasiticus TaxID=78921 RepID=A0A9W7ZZ22_9FUNG|nr:hypothetical protein IWQ60_007852 [Tieghemiomyces parasiticus]